MVAVRSARDWIKRFDVFLYFVTALFALYLAAANILRGAKWPDEATWAPWKVWFVLILVCALWVPLYALYKALDAHFAKTDEATLELQRDLELVCQQTVAAIADACPGVAVNDLAAQVWLCRPDGSFDRRARFYLPHERPSSGIVWRKGKGVAGMAWKAGKHLRADLRPLYEQLDQLGSDAFDRLPPDERMGMTASELSDTRDYVGICAIRLFPQSTKRAADPQAGEGEEQPKPDPLAVFAIDYAGDGDQFGCIVRESKKRPVTTFLGSCGKTLTAKQHVLQLD